MNDYWYSKKLNCSFYEAIDDVTFSLKEQWFWVLNSIDIKDKIKEKIWVDIDDYVILWACHPSLAYTWIKLEQEIWLFLPCNVIVYKKWNDIYVSSILPTVAMWMIKNDDLYNLALEVELKLKNAIDNI